MGVKEGPMGVLPRLRGPVFFPPTEEVGLSGEGDKHCVVFVGGDFYLGRVC